ncbi:response regulator transcription factor [Desulfococcus sp.]|uniref:response regulator n=1 Tax=Desulfococcus sp. TaxID=2025834 RepID=UPI0035937882
MAIRVLLVIDPGIGWEGLRRLIQQHPCLRLAAEASDIRSALELTRRLQPDIVILDINIPLPEIIRTVQNMIRHAPAVKVITISMQSDRLYAEKSFLSGVSGYLLKECAYEELIPAIHHVMTGRAYLSRDIFRIRA